MHAAYNLRNSVRPSGSPMPRVSAILTSQQASSPCVTCLTQCCWLHGFQRFLHVHFLDNSPAVCDNQCVLETCSVKYYAFDYALGPPAKCERMSHSRQPGCICSLSKNTRLAHVDLSLCVSKKPIKSTGLTSGTPRGCRCCFRGAVECSHAHGQTGLGSIRTGTKRALMVHLSGQKCCC